jgi:competence protein ComEC
MIWVVAMHPFPPRLEKGRLALTLLDVGQGDAMTITFPAGHVMQLDSGGRRHSALRRRFLIFPRRQAGIGEVAVAPYLWHLGIKDLDVVAATHSDADHIQGFLDIIPALEFNAPLLSRPSLGGMSLFPIVCSRTAPSRKPETRQSV